MKNPQESQPPEPSLEEKLNRVPPLPRVRIRFGIYLLVFGFLFFLLGAKPELFGMDRSPVVGFIQISAMIIGIGIICLAGYLVVHSLWRGTVPSIASDIGLRLVSTGFVITIFSAMADVFGIGSSPLPSVPFFGVWQARGMEIGLGFIAVGFVMMFPYRTPHI